MVPMSSSAFRMLSRRCYLRRRQQTSLECFSERSESGKTKVFLGIIALAFDNGYDLALILTKPTTALAKQTYKRLNKEFAEFIESDQAKVYDILEIPERLTQFELNQKMVFVVKKQTDKSGQAPRSFT